MKRALIVEGGAMRGIFSIGVLDVLIEKNFYDFDQCIGVSAGSTAVASYLAGMQGRNYLITTDYSTRDEFISLSKYLRGKHFMDLDWLWNHCETHYPLDVSKILDRGIEFKIGVTNVNTGLIEYIKPTKDNAIDLLKASCALPLVYRKPVIVEGTAYMDGGIADPIPVEEAIRSGAKEIIIIRSRKKDYRMKAKRKGLSYYLLNKYPKLRDVVHHRPHKYNQSISLLRHAHEGIHIIEINPPEGFETTRFTKDKKVLDKDYQLGIETGNALIKQLCEA